MKKGLIVMMIVLMTMALITSCNSEAASTTDSLVEVKIAEGADSKSLNVGSTSNLPDISTLKWYYQATKKTGVFINGQTSGFVAVPNVATGLEGASLGQFSTGEWDFQFKGVVNNEFAGTENETVIFTSSVIRKEVSLSTAVNDTVYLTVPLTANADKAKVTFSNLSWNKPDGDKLVSGAASDFVLTITESDPANTSTWNGNTYDNSKVSFTLADNSTSSFSYATAGAHAYTFTVRYKNEVVAVYDYNVNVALGSDYTVTGSIDGSSNVQYSVVVKDVPVSVNDNSATVQGSATTTTFTVNQTPASVTAGTMSNTTIEFTNNSDPQNAVINTADSYYIAQATYGAEEAANFVITASENSSNAVAGIDLDLYKVVEQGIDEKQTVTNQSVKVTTTIAKGLKNVSVTNDGSTEGITVISYGSDTGLLVFTTTHFSKFLVTSSNEAINTTTNVAYETLVSAVDAASANDTIMLLKDCTYTNASLNHTVSYTTSKSNTKKVVMNITKSLTINGNGYSVKTSTPQDNSSVGIAVVANNVSLHVKDLVISDVWCSLFVGENVTGANINLYGCDFSVYGDGYCIKTCNGADNMQLNIANSGVAGYAALNIRSNNSAINITDSDLTGTNKASATNWNNYATVVIDGDSYFSSVVGQHGCGNTVNISKTKIYATSESTNKQDWVSIQYGALNNTVTVLADAESQILGNNDNDKRTGISICDTPTAENRNTVRLILNADQVSELQSYGYVVESVANNDNTYDVKLNPNLTVKYNAGTWVDYKSINLIFSNKELCSGENLTLENDLTLSRNLDWYISSDDTVAKINSNPSKLIIDNHTITQGDYHINLMSSSLKLKSDSSELSGVLSAPAGYHIVCSEKGTDNYYTYSCDANN